MFLLLLLLPLRFSLTASFGTFLFLLLATSLVGLPSLFLSLPLFIATLLIPVAALFSLLLLLLAPRVLSSVAVARILLLGLGKASATCGGAHGQGQSNQKYSQVSSFHKASGA